MSVFCISLSKSGRPHSYRRGGLNWNLFDPPSTKNSASFHYLFSRSVLRLEKSGALILVSPVCILFATLARSLKRLVTECREPTIRTHKSNSQKRRARNNTSTRDTFPRLFSCARICWETHEFC